MNHKGVCRRAPDLLKNVYQGTHIALDRSTSKYMKVCKSGSNTIKVHYILGAPLYLGNILSNGKINFAFTIHVKYFCKVIFWQSYYAWYLYFKGIVVYIIKLCVL